MVSILLPVYNFPIAPLVTDLVAQATRLDIAWEIRCYDDGSSLRWKQENRVVANQPNVHYVELPANLGRAAIRNLLAREARHPYLLFLDNDSGIVQDDFLSVYRAELPTDAVLYGGRTYAAQRPADPALLLHWTYGHTREALPLAQRRRAPYASFMTNNFCIPRTTMLDLPFDEQLTQYGHEDTLFGEALALRQIPIVHLANPVAHLGLETADTFLRKQREALSNLQLLHTRYPDFQTRLLRWKDRLQHPFTQAALRSVRPWLLPRLEKHLHGPAPRMRALDLWKLLLIAEE